jgi:hypothetical protein
MGPAPGPPLPGRPAYRLLFLLAALDRAGWGLWALLLPDGLFTLLRWPEAPTPDQLLLWRVLGGLALVHALFFVILLCWPEACAPVAVVPMIGLMLGTGVWLWVGASERLVLPWRAAPLLPGAHDVIWLLPLAWFLAAWQRWRRGVPPDPSEARP